MNRLDGKTVIVTGGTAGIGLATARQILEEGARVAITGRDPERGAKALSELGSDRATYHEHQASSRESWDAVVAAVLEETGRVDGLVNNAGINAAPVPLAGAADFEEVVATNLTGPFHGMQAVIPAMRAQGGGSIVNVSSSGGLMGIPLTAGYAASKWGLRGVTRVGAVELARHKIRVNSVHPGMVYTQMTAESAGLVEGEGNYPPAPIGRVARAEEIGGAVVYLLSDEATYTTGAEIAVDGAWTAGIAPIALLGPEFADALLG